MSREDATGSNGPGRAASRLQGPNQVLVGRAREQALLRDELATASGGHGRLCLIGGESGIGKTTLARDLARAADKLGVRVLTGSCYELDSTPPYGPWLDLFEASLHDPTLPSPPAALAGGQLSSVDDQGVLFADVRRYLAELVADRPALLVLEDFHWADPASLDLLRHIGPHLRHWPILLIVTYRSEDLVPGHPFVQHLPALVRETDGCRIDLRRLDEDALRELVAAQIQLPREDENRLLEYLETHAEGNPFFATEILRSLEDIGLLRRGHEGWSLGSLDQVVVPPLLRQVIEARVIRLGDESRKLLAIAAVVGQEASLHLWAEVADLDVETLLGIVERAVEANLLEAKRDGVHIHFVHSLTREALYEGILPPRRRIWHASIADAMLASDRVDPEAVAFHLQQAGDPRAVEWLIRAGERAQNAYAWLTAAERFRSAAGLLRGGDEQDPEYLRLLMRIAYRLRFAYPNEANSALDEALRLAEEAGDLRTAGEAMFQRGGLNCYADRFRAGLIDLERGCAMLESNAPDAGHTTSAVWTWLSDAITSRNAGTPSHADERLVLRMQNAGTDVRRLSLPWFLAAAGRLAEANATAERAMDAAGDGAEPLASIRLLTAFAHHGVATAATALARPADARRNWSLARAEFHELGHHVLEAFTVLDEMRDLAIPWSSAEPETRRRLAAEAETALGRAVGALRPGVSPRIAQLRSLIADGFWDEALRLLDELPQPGNAFLRRETTFARAYLARHRAEPRLAWSEIRTLLPQGPATEPGDSIHQEGLFLQRLAAGLCLDAGDLPGAESWLTANDTWLDWSGSVLGRAAGQVAWGRYHQAAGAPGPARAHLTEALRLASSPAQPLVQLAAHRSLGEIDRGMNRPREAEAHLAAALTLAESCEVPFERALTFLALAELREMTGATAAALALAEEARDILATLGAEPALIRATTVAARLTSTPATGPRPFGLTERELEVLRLIAEGKTNQEIADELYISRRTAATHVSNIFGKLDVTSRAEAVNHAHRHGLLSDPPSPGM